MGQVWLAPDVRRMISGRRSYTWSAVVIAFIAALVAVMAPFRDHLTVATPGLVLVVPVVAGTIAGGLYAGLIAVVVGSLAYDLFFIPPYGTLTVGNAQYWVTLLVYVVVMVIVVRVVDALERVRAEALIHQMEAKRLFELSELVTEDRTVAELLETIVVTVQKVFGTRGVALLLPVGDRLEVVASSGDSIPEDDLATLASSSGSRVDLGTTMTGGDELRAVALSTPGHPIGLLVVHEGAGIREDRELLRTFANHMSMALERAQLRQTAMRVGMLQEVDRLRRSLVSAVSHDLRTPLATIKVAVSSLRAPDAKLSGDERGELLGLVEAQADRLDRLVTNLLDMTRLQAGVLEPRHQSVSVAAILEDAVGALGVANGPTDLSVELPADLPIVDVDRVLVGQVFANLLENAARFAPDGTPVTVTAKAMPDAVRVTVADHGPGVPPSDRDGLFEMFSRNDAGGRAGLGLAISKAFVEAHGEHIWFEDVPGGGACFAFDLPRAKELVKAS
jgi:two-component system, OmpR family, sensor histidine kinase KdpD